jgi:chorismate mutase
VKARRRAVRSAAHGPREGRAGGERGIEEHRRRIDAIDDQLVRLLNERAGWAVRLGGVKKRLGLPVYSAERESQILARVSTRNCGPLEEAAIRRLFERIIDESRRIERLAVQEPAAPPERKEE